MLRFLQTGDWHLGQAYRKFDASLADRLRASRLEVIGRILQEAERSGSAFVAVTGDQFDGPRPDPLLVRGMLVRIGASRVAVHMIPGNHDPCGPGSVYERGDFKARPKNLHFHDQPRAVSLPEQDATLFPCPCSARFGDDPLSWIPPRGPGQGWRIALAHGALPVALRADERNYPIADDAPRRYDLDYVALGDWHTATPDPLRNPRDRMYYAGAPEVGGWDETGAGFALEVILESGLEPRVRPIRVGRHEWSELRPTLYSSEDVGRLAGELDGLASLDRIVRVRPSGSLSLGDRETLQKAIDGRVPMFAGLHLDAAELRLALDGDGDPPSDPILREVYRRLLRLGADPSDGFPKAYPRGLPAPDADVIARAMSQFRGLMN